MNYIMDKETTLMSFLLTKYSRTNAKAYLKYKQVYVNDLNTSQFDRILHVGDIVEINKDKKMESDLNILYEDDDFIVINKPSGLLSVAGGGESNKTAFHLVNQYLKTKDKKTRAYVVHRLDKDTSGILMFSKSEEMKETLQANWNDIVSKRGYIAIVEGNLSPKSGTIKNYLDESKTQQVYICKSGGKLAITNYKVIKENRFFSMVDIDLKTGRKNQIRVHMQSIGHSIVDDKKYGASSNPIKRLGLHCHCFAFKHPTTQKEMQFTAPIPSSFTQLFQ
ncbi:MAG: RluA family pseudouridine synthase [Erysipelotrichaceae bacterium]